MASVSYKKLFKLLIDKEIKQKDLAEKAGISIATLTKMKKGEGAINSNILDRICCTLDCSVGDIMEIIPEDKPTEQTYDTFAYFRVATEEQIESIKEPQMLM